MIWYHDIVIPYHEPCYLITVLITNVRKLTMELANVSNRILTQRVNELLTTAHSESYISQVRQDKEGSPALRRVVREEVVKMLQEATDAAKAAA